MCEPRELLATLRTGQNRQLQHSRLLADVSSRTYRLRASFNLPPLH